MRILGIDPGTATTGWGVVEKSKIKNQKSKLTLIDYGCILTDKKHRLSSRFKIIYNEIGKIIKKYQPDYVALERLFFFKNLKTAFSVGEARGVIKLAIEMKKLPMVEYTPLQIKQILADYGRADKRVMQSKVRKILGLRRLPRPDDAADALAVAICYVKQKGKKDATT